MYENSACVVAAWLLSGMSSRPYAEPIPTDDQAAYAADYHQVETLIAGMRDPLGVPEGANLNLSPHQVRNSYLRIRRESV